MRSFAVLLLACNLIVYAPIAVAEDVWSGNFWLRICKDEGAGLCSGFLGGMVAMNELNVADGQRAYWCPPKGVTVDQIKALVVAEMAKHPEDWHQEFVMLAAAILRSKFPCIGDTR